mmetsp:Transcript_37399/g.149245  ORF Transcript_37399/g.149245 Transcript_37399/m.149245 type:complete len:317 (-) Transcript_37399:1480-2430(-)
MVLQNLTLLFPLESSEVNLDLIGELLLNYGALSVSFEDAEKGTDSEQPLFREPPPGAVEWDSSQVEGQVFWNSVTVKALFPSEAGVEAIMLAIGSDLELPIEPRFIVESLKDEDWVKKVQSTFKPIAFKKIYITFPWRTEPIDPAMIPVILEPGSAFGTGEHPTTRLCIRWLEEVLTERSEEKLLDYGSGSGILSIIARKLGCPEVAGVEIDQDAIEIAKKNVDTNDAADGSIQFYLPSERIPDSYYSLTVANILALPLIQLAPTIASKTASGGRLALSGVLARQAEVSRLVRSGLRLVIFTLSRGHNKCGPYLMP